MISREDLGNPHGVSLEPTGTRGTYTGIRGTSDGNLRYTVGNPNSFRGILREDHGTPEYTVEDPAEIPSKFPAVGSTGVAMWRPISPHDMSHGMFIPSQHGGFLESTVDIQDQRVESKTIAGS